MYAAIGYAALAAFQYFSGQAQASSMRAQGRYQQKIADMNADYAEFDAYEAEKSGYAEAAAYEKIIDQTIGEQKVQLAAADVDVNYGTAADLQSESRLNGILNVLDFKKAAYERAKGFKNEARNLRIGGQTARSQATLNANATSVSSTITAAGYGLRGAEAAGAFSKTSPESRDETGEYIEGYSGRIRVGNKA
jgi:hypothetical protein